MPATRGDIEHLLEQLGYRRDDGDHRRFRLYFEGRLIAATMTSHGTREIHDGLLATIAGQMRIRPAFLRNLLAGRKRPQDYVAELRKQGLLPGKDTP